MPIQTLATERWYGDTKRTDAERIELRDKAQARIERITAQCEAGEIPTDGRGRPMGPDSFLNAITQLPSGKSRAEIAKRGKQQSQQDACREVLEDSILDGTGLSDPLVRAYCFLKVQSQMRDGAGGTADLLGSREVCELYGIQRSQIQRFIQADKLPTPFKRSASGPQWRESDLPETITTRACTYTRKASDPCPF